jgi:hypothetical protein
MRKIFLGIIIIGLSISPLFAWKIYLEPKPDSSGRVNYGITCNAGNRVIVTYNIKQSYKPYFADSHTFKSLNSAANYACKNKSNNKGQRVKVKQGSVFCEVANPIREMAKSEMKKAWMMMTPTKEMSNHCMRLRESVQVKVIKHYKPKTYDKKFEDTGKNKKWTVKTKFNDTYYKVSDGKEYFYVLGTDVY